jgi:hypothetical protein
VERVSEIVKLNQKGIIPENLENFNEKKPIAEVGYHNDAGQDSISRFEEKRKAKKKKHRRNKNPLQ